ncbi:MAG: 4Fe-4S dicluster domain-containing protein, partial [Chloroflexi bacterium]|nr:4Fe-4S dicluster domain-containing protein [Chloroflexota bacterium]
MIRSEALDTGFMQEVMQVPGGENIVKCWSCGTCAATCLVRRYDPTFNPRLILRKAGLGLRQEVLASREIWLCSACDACYLRCPQQIHISEVMAAIRSLAIAEGYEAPGPFAEVDAERCSGCAVCTRACPYGALERTAVTVNGLERMIAQVDRTLCMHCGVCVAACPSSSITLEEFSTEEVIARMGAGGWLEEGSWQGETAREPRILAFVCQWSMRSDADWATLHAMQSDTLRVVNLPCS